MARQWIRLYTRSYRNSKLEKLPDHLFRFLVKCWCLCGESDTQTLPDLDEIAYQFRVDRGLAEGYLKHLEVGQYLDRDEDGNLTPHDWDELQFESDTSTVRTRNYRERKKKKSCDVTVTSRERSPSVSVSVSESVSGKGVKGETMTPALDEQFQEFARLYGEIGSPIPEDFMNNSWTWRHWNGLDFTQKCLAVQSLRDRIAAGHVVMHKPENYLKDGAYKRKIQQRRNGSGNSAAELAAL